MHFVPQETMATKLSLPWMHLGDKLDNWTLDRRMFGGGPIHILSSKKCGLQGLKHPFRKTCRELETEGKLKREASSFYPLRLCFVFFICSLCDQWFPCIERWLLIRQAKVFFDFFAGTVHNIMNYCIDWQCTHARTRGTSSPRRKISLCKKTVCQEKQVFPNLGDGRSWQANERLEGYMFNVAGTWRASGSLKLEARNESHHPKIPLS